MTCMAFACSDASNTSDAAVEVVAGVVGFFCPRSGYGID